MAIKKSTLYLLCLLTLVGFPALAYVVLFFFDDNYFFKDAFVKHTSIPIQLLAGFLYGCAIGGFGIAIVKHNIAKPIKSMLNKVLGNINITWLDVVFFSFCAGFGEEIFFRGALQHFAGIWPTAIFFIFIHGYLSFNKGTQKFYGIFMVVIVAGMGYLDNYFGIWAAIMAHFVYDVFMFAYLTKYQKPLADTTS